MKIDSVSSAVISKTVPLFGMFVRGVAKVPLLEKPLGAANRIFGRVLPWMSFLGFRKEASFENAVWNWEVFLRLIGAEYDVEEASTDSKLYIIKKCPVGHCRQEHLGACNATMELDKSLVERSGARLIVYKQFPSDGVCVERVAAREWGKTGI
jgi:hypothetical protein